MIRSTVNARSEAVVRLRVRGPASPELVVEVVVDSGFNASLTLPAATVATLGLARRSRGEAVLADGGLKYFDIYAAEVEWEGIWRPVLVYTVGAEALMGMQLLAGYELRIAVVPGGPVEISRLP